jgi:hypothetical protein
MFSADRRHIFPDGPVAFDGFKATIERCGPEKIRFSGWPSRMRAKNRFVRLQATDPNLACFRSIFAANPDHFEAGFMIAVLDTNGFPHVDAINPYEPGARLGDVQSVSMLHEGLSVTIQSPHPYFEVEFHTWFTPTAHKVPEFGQLSR